MREEVLKLAKEMMEKDPSLTEWISTKFPELKESEDEIFRKYILKCCEETIQANDRGLELSMDTTKKLKNWLEKQGNEKKEFHERYKKVAKSDWFKKSHEGMSCGMITDEEIGSKRYKYS